jgi:TetR/AcrR family transcriptional regulator, cholesterol catabolism regulator
MASAAADRKADRRAKAPRRRHDEILEAAARVFHEKGYESTSIQDIADAVGILKGSLYYYIDSKEDLLYEILEGIHAEALASVRKATAEGDPLQRIRAFVAAHIRHNAENLVKMALFFQDFRSLGEERRRSIVADRDAYEQFLRDLIRDGQVAEQICPEVDVKRESIAILGLMNWLYHWYQPGGEYTIDELADAYADFVVAGLACDPKTHVPGHRRRLAA